MAATCYLIHFETKLHHAGHYLGYTNDLQRRLAEHRAGTGARLMEVIKERGISWVLARTWAGGHDLELALKRYHNGRALCPICKQAEIIRKLGLKPMEETTLFG